MTVQYVDVLAAHNHLDFYLFLVETVLEHDIFQGYFNKIA